MPTQVAQLSLLEEALAQALENRDFYTKEIDRLTQAGASKEERVAMSNNAMEAISWLHTARKAFEEDLIKRYRASSLKDAPSAVLDGLG